MNEVIPEFYNNNGSVDQLAAAMTNSLALTELPMTPFGQAPVAPPPPPLTREQLQASIADLKKQQKQAADVENYDRAQFIKSEIVKYENALQDVNKACDSFEYPTSVVMNRDGTKKHYITQRLDKYDVGAMAGGMPYSEQQCKEVKDRLRINGTRTRFRNSALR